jgi:nickel transport protein
MLCGLCAALMLLALPDAARAHRAYLFAWDEDGLVCSESYYSKTARIADAELVVRDADGRELLRGRSDREGRFCFARPNNAELLLSVDTGQGHRGEFRLSAKTSPPPRREQEPGLREIMGGLGSIAGLAALFAWCRRRRAS